MQKVRQKEIWSSDSVTANDWMSKYENRESRERGDIYGFYVEKAVGLRRKQGVEYIGVCITDVVKFLKELQEKGSKVRFVETRWDYKVLEENKGIEREYTLRLLKPDSYSQKIVEDVRTNRVYLTSTVLSHRTLTLRKRRKKERCES